MGNMNTYYDQLMALKGANELKELLKKWETFSQNMKERPFDSPIILPDLFLYTPSGYGNTRMLSLLADYLCTRENLMSFYGDVKLVEFKLYYCDPHQEFTEMYRLMEVIQAAAGFRNEYRGIVRININDWVEHHKERHFLEFLQFLKVNTKNWLIVLTISSTEENDETREMESIVSMYLRIETISLKLPSVEEMVDFASNTLSTYGLTLDDSAKDVLLESIKVLRSNKYFYGMHTIADLCSDIVYTLFSSTTTVSRVVTAQMLKDFNCESEYIKRTIIKIKKTHTLGF